MRFGIRSRRWFFWWWRGQFLGIRRPGLVIVMNPILLEFVMGNITALGFQRFGRHRRAGVAMMVAGVVAVGLLICGVVFWGPQVKSRPGKLLIAVGNASYSIYLTSEISTEMISRLMTRIPIEGLRSGPFFLRAGISLVCVILAGMVCFWFVETPLLRWLNSRYKSIFGRRTMPATPAVGV